jgi:hypothetical protein
VSLGFLDIDGNPIVPFQLVSVKPSQAAWIELHSSSLVRKRGDRVIVAPVVAPPPGSLVAPLETTIELK